MNERERERAQCEREGEGESGELERSETWMEKWEYREIKEKNTNWSAV